MKCDVEGAELLVFRGARETIGTWRPVIFSELNDQYSTRYGYGMNDVFEFFSARSYRTFTVDGGCLRPLSASAYSGEGDVVFVPSELQPPASCV
jgi:hypothetical protein